MVASKNSSRIRSVFGRNLKKIKRAKLLSIIKRLSITRRESKRELSLAQAMEEAYLDEGPAGNFETATLEIANEYNTLISEGPTGSRPDTEVRVPQSTATAKNALNIPYQNVDIHSFFSDRSEIVERAIKDCTENLINEEERDVLEAWLLTEITLWDVEKERLVLLTAKAIYSVKYDFISLKILGYDRVPLSKLDAITVGELIYPPSSLAPRLNGLAEGMSSIVHTALRQEWSALSTCTGLSQFEPRKRHMTGIRLMWNKGSPLSSIKKWNPFAKDIPWLTYASHPLFWYKGSESDKARFDVERLHFALLNLLPRECRTINASIIVENYFGLGALVHNRNSLGFFKNRGRISF